MIATAIDADRVAGRYLEQLNRSYAGWGDRRFYEWVFQRDAGCGLPDLFVLEADGVWHAGSCVSYRRVRGPAGIESTAAVMTGSWTRPEARRMGLFSRMIRESQRLASLRGASFLLAFVTESNASFRRLEAAGAAMQPSVYGISSGTGPSQVEATSVRTESSDGEALQRLYESFVSQRTSSGHFAYTPDAWRGQFVDRALPVERVGDDRGASALIEHSDDADRVLTVVSGNDQPASRLAFLEGLRRRARRRGRSLFLYGTSDQTVQLARRLGMSVQPGAVAVLPASPGGGAPPHQPGSWTFEGGDRI
jgi:hypothetical protein